MRKKLKCNKITYAHAKHRYELQIPEYLVLGNKKPDFLDFSSRKKGF